MPRHKRKPAKAARDALPLTVSRPELLTHGSDRDFRRLVHNLIAFAARHQALRDGMARHIGLAGVDYTILIAIGHLGLDGEVNVKTVAEHLHMSGAFITTVTSKLRRQGLIEKTPDKADRRRISLALTVRGTALLRKLAPFQREINDVEFGTLTKERFRLLSAVIEEMIAASDKALSLQQYKASAKIA